MKEKSFVEQGETTFKYVRDNKGQNQIPWVIDVLYCLDLHPEWDQYKQGNELYDFNVHRAAVAASRFGISRHSGCPEKERAVLIARAIIDLCPEPARCFFEPAFMAAKRIAGEQVPSRGDLRREAWQMLCPCSSCQHLVQLEWLKDMATD